MARRPPPASTPVVSDAIEPAGVVRRSQLVSTFGIGAIVDLEKGSFMPMGLEDWERINNLPSLSINEDRLRQLLRVSHFRLGPVMEKIKGSTKVRAGRAAPVTRFPEWHECPKCHRLGREGEPFEIDEDGARLRCTAHHAKVYTGPVRFVVACGHGHISDFPWEWWAHRGRTGKRCERPALYLGSHGRSASLADLYVQCRACGAEGDPTQESLGSAFGVEALKDHACSGYRPWLHDRQANCPEKLRVLQRGASNVHFAVVGSALSIPPGSEAVSQIVEELRDILDSLPEAALPGVLSSYSAKYDVPVSALFESYRRILGQQGSKLTEEMARTEEYDALSLNRNDPVISGITPQFQNEILVPPSGLEPWFDLIGAASRLREVRALAGFSRIEPRPVPTETIGDEIAAGKISPLSKTPRDWLPGAEIRGEGVFLRFRSEAIDDWVVKNKGVGTRAELLDAQSQKLADDRGYSRHYSVTPRLLLVHSFAHALIRQISVECGYSASAIRERLYVTEGIGRRTTNGVLIYTGSPDSEGSLGGLVRLAAPELLGPIIRRALRNAAWCGSDPVCLETDPKQSGERVSGAACHCCQLLPETACEKFNRELDRTVLVGDAEGTFKGFFDELASDL